MAVDLFDLVEVLKREVSPPGSNLFPAAVDEEWLGYLRDAFWEIRLDGMLEGFEETDGSVTPSDEGGDDLGRDMQQLIVIYAGLRIVLTQLRDAKTTFRAQAGPVEFETGQSAGVLREVLAELRQRRHLMLTRLSDLGAIPTYYIDAVAARQDSYSYGDISWVNS